MRITSIAAEIVEMGLVEPFVIAYETFTTAANVFVQLETDTGHVGVGCAGPDAHVTGESCQSIREDIVNEAEPVLRGADPQRYGLLLAQLRAQGLGGRPGVMAALDMALLDLCAKAAGLPLWRMLGGYRASMVTSMTLSILDLEATVEKAKHWAGQGFKRLKIKGGLDYKEDARRVRKVREAVGPDLGLCFDANQGFTPAQTLDFVNRSREAQLEFVEQPTNKQFMGCLIEVAAVSLTPIMADECMLGPVDALELVRRNACHMINIKLMKVGGIAAAGDVESIARAGALPVMTGCMSEAAVGIAAGLAFALSRPSVAYADLDGSLDLTDDPTAAAVTLQDGVLFPSQEPGLGIRSVF